VERLRRIAPDYRYSLSVDVPTNQGTDMFSKMRALFMLQRSLRTQADPEACLFTFFQEPAECRDGMITAREVLEAATVIPPFLRGLGRRIYAAIFSFCAGVIPPLPMFGRSWL
jgi:hypothetical protein